MKLYGALLIIVENRFFANSITREIYSFTWNIVHYRMINLIATFHNLIIVLFFLGKIRFEVF